MRSRIALVLIAALVAGGTFVMQASAHPERNATFPVPSVCYGGPPCAVPRVRASGPSLVVCKPDSADRLRRAFARDRRTLAARLALLERCRYRDIQAAVDAARNRTRILVMPGVYLEEPSRRIPFTPAKCSDQASYFDVTEGNSTLPPPAGPASNDPPVRPNFKFQHDCSNARNLIAIIGDSNQDGRCDAKCGLQIEGMGRRPEDVDIRGDRTKMDVIRGDRADGLVIRNLSVESAAFNGIDVVETNGFRLEDLLARWNQDYGVLSFTSDHGLFNRIVAYGNGDSGVYPGSDPKGCGANGVHRYSIELRNIDSYGNTLGYSGTAANSVWIHDSSFHHNAAGISTDSFASGHPGMPQECAKWEHNRIYSNNFNPFDAANQNYCRTTPFPLRAIRHVCPQFQAPVGSGIILYGANRDLIRDNAIYDNWRSGIRYFYIPAAVRGDNDPALQQDTSNGVQVVHNTFGISPEAEVLPNGSDITWDGGGSANCFEDNRGTGNLLDPAGITSEYQAMLPACPGSAVFMPPNPVASAREVPCAAWDPSRQPNPPGCDWFTVPPRPGPPPVNEPWDPAGVLSRLLGVWLP
jgi:hypothetical protein